jgi:hypothetical protein
VIEELIGRMAALLDSLQATGDPRRYFLATYRAIARSHSTGHSRLTAVSTAAATSSSAG